MSFDIGRTNHPTSPVATYLTKRPSTVAPSRETSGGTDVVSMDLTTLARPMAPGIVSHVLSANPNLSKTEIKRILLDSATAKSAEGGSILDTSVAVQKAIAHAEKPMQSPGNDNSTASYLGKSSSGQALYTLGPCSSQHNPAVLTISMSPSPSF